VPAFLRQKHLKGTEDSLITYPAAAHRDVFPSVKSENGGDRPWGIALM
jgi:hypothetical protein